MSTVCGICPHACALPEGGYGLCRARKCQDSKIVDANYAKVTSVALDPIEKKPLNRFLPGSMVLSVGSFGCNLSCQFCQNSDISMHGEEIPYRNLPPQDLVEMAVDATDHGNVGVAYTYNEPLVGYEYVLDCARMVHANGMKNVLVTNGYINPGPLKNLLPHIDAMNIDLKAFSEEFYQMVGGDLKIVKDTIRQSAAQCHVEVTTLVIPGYNDDKQQMRAQCEWLAGINPDIPLHVSRFFPRYNMLGVSATPLHTIEELADIARERLTYVYMGNC